MHTLIYPKPDDEIWDEFKVRELLINQSTALCIPVFNELKLVNIEMKNVKEWKEKSIKVVNLLETNPKQKTFPSD